MADRYDGRPGARPSDRSRGTWIRTQVRRIRGEEEASFELVRGFDLDHWLAATGGIPAGLVDRPERQGSPRTPLQARPIMSMTVALLIVTAGLVAAANVSMPTGAVGESGDPAAAVPTTTDGGDDADGSGGAAAVSPTETVSPAPTASPTATPTATPAPADMPTESDPVDDLVETVDDTVDDTSDTVDDTVDDTNETVDSTL